MSLLGPTIMRIVLLQGRYWGPPIDAVHLGEFTVQRLRAYRVYRDGCERANSRLLMGIALGDIVPLK